MKEILSMEQVTYLFKGFFLLFMVTLLPACIDDDDPLPPEPIGPTTPTPPPTGTLTGTGNKEVSKALMGTWKTRCLSKNEGTGSAEVTWSFTMTDFSYKFDQYSDNACSKKDDSSESSGAYSVGIEEITSPEDYPAYDIDFTSSDGSTSVKSLISLSKDKTTFLLPFPDTTRPSDFSKAKEYTKTKGGTRSSDLEGRWGTECIVLDDGTSGILRYAFNKNQFTWSLFAYSDSNCKTEDSRDDLSGKTVVGEMVTTDDGHTARKLDLKFDGGTVQKRLYALAKTESGREALILSSLLKDGSRPTALNPAVAYIKSNDSKSAAKNSVKEPEFLESIEVQGYALTTDLSLELKERFRRDIDISENTDGSFMQKFRELNDLLPNQEGLRSGDW